MKQGDDFTPALPNKCNINYPEIPLPLSEASTNFISIDEKENIIHEFLEQWNFENKNLTIRCFDCCKEEAKCTCQDYQEDVVIEMLAF